MTPTRHPQAFATFRDRRTQKNELLRLCVRVGFTPPGDLQP
ncbi:MAG: hypothetical protein ACM3L9_07450 [Deltaproteobacteria bacterium]